eukprot:7391638-Prymnesium_polylepis.3
MKLVRLIAGQVISPRLSGGDGGGDFGITLISVSGEASVISHSWGKCGVVGVPAASVRRTQHTSRSIRTINTPCDSTNDTAPLKARVTDPATSAIAAVISRVASGRIKCTVEAAPVVRARSRARKRKYVNAAIMAPMVHANLNCAEPSLVPVGREADDDRRDSVLSTVEALMLA